MSTNLDGAIAAWKNLLGPGQVLLGEAVAQAYGHDASGVSRQVPAALRIVNASLLPQVMRIAQHCRVSVYPLSTGRNWGYGSAMPAQDNCVIVDLGGLDRILHFDAELGVVTVEPGVTQGMLASFLDEGGHDFLVPVTGAGPSCSLLGNALERGYGVTPIADHFAAVTDIEAVLADGSLYRSALHEAGNPDLARLFKWGIGPYLNGLFTQSGFGIVTQMTILLARRPSCVKVCLFSLKEDSLLEPAVARIRRLLSTLPGTLGAINLMNRHRVLAMSIPYPEQQLGSDGLIPEKVIESLGRQYQIYPWTGFATLYGSDRMINAAKLEVRDALRGVASRVLFLSPGQARGLAKATRWLPGSRGRRLATTAATLAKSLDLVAGRPNETALPLAYWRNPTPFSAQQRNPSRDGCGLIWYAPLVPMRPVGVRSFVEMVKTVAPRHKMEPLITLTTLSDKLFDSTVPLIFNRQDKAALHDAKACYQDLLEQGSALGSYPYRLGVDAMQSYAARHPLSGALSSRLRQAVDEHDIVSPARYR
ncbi:MAG: FAD-binding oxidoreductase [Burkholderiaceae bacterium]|nr:FAD-binding oxidoreductase [Burkholderiaceae bacterium]